MARLGKAKMAKWDRELEKAVSIVRKVNGEQRECYLSAKGGRLSDLTRALNTSASAAVAIGAARGSVMELEAAEERRKPKVTA